MINISVADADIYYMIQWTPLFKLHDLAVAHCFFGGDEPE